MSEVLVANQDAAFTAADGVPVVIEQGRTLARDTHPYVKDYPGLWSPLDITYDVDEPEPEPAPRKPSARKQGAASE